MVTSLHLRYKMADALVILLPPMTVLILLIIVLFIFSCISQSNWWKYNVRSKWQRELQAKSSKLSFAPNGHPYREHSDIQQSDIQLEITNTERSANTERSTDTKRSTHTERSSTQLFLNHNEYLLVEKLLRYQNAPHSLIILGLPTIVTLAFCPLTIFLYGPMMIFFWPNSGIPPNINDAVASFLTPAGLVYAIAFGFAFQQALEKQGMADSTLKSLDNAMRQILLLIDTSSMSKAQSHSMREFLKDETVGLIEMIVLKKKVQNSVLWQTREKRYKDVLVTAKSFPVHSQYDVQYSIHSKLMDQILMLHKKTANSDNIVMPTMHFLQWAFLELLGFFAFFGIILINAESQPLQLTMCMLTVYSISMFCYILADLDQAHHGVFRVDLSILVTFLEQLYKEWDPVEDTAESI